VVRPKGRHLATIVWLHGIGDNGARYPLIARLMPTFFLKLCFIHMMILHACYLMQLPHECKLHLSIKKGEN
jgi:hypothetical protein